MFRKPKRNIRLRVKDEEEEDNSEVKTVTTGISNMSREEDVDLRPQDEDLRQETTHQEKSKPPSKLSFLSDDREEEDVLEIKKSSFSRRMTKQLDREKRKREKEMAEKRRLHEQLNREQDQDLRVIQETKKEPEELEEVIQIPDEDPFSDDSSPEDDHQRNIKFRIPDAKTIFALKKQRESRKHNEEFISLTTSIPRRPRQFDDESDEEDDVSKDSKKRDQYDEEFNEEEEERIEFDDLKTKEREREAAREAIESMEEKKPDYDSDDEEEEDRLTRWEQEQIMKGVGTHSVKVMRDKVEKEMMGNVMLISSSPTHESSGFFDETTREGEIPLFIQEESKETVTVEEVLALMEDMMDQRKDKIGYLDRQLTNLSSEEKLLQNEVDQLESQQKELESKRRDLHEKLKEIELESNSTTDVIQ